MWKKTCKFLCDVSVLSNCSATRYLSWNWMGVRLFTVTVTTDAFDETHHQHQPAQDTAQNIDRANDRESSAEDDSNRDDHQ